MEGIVTGEGVLLDTRPVGFASRVLASLVDIAALALVTLGAVWLGSQLDLGLQGWDGRIVTVVVLATVTVILPTTVETLTRGRSLGKWVAGVRIVRDDGGPVRGRQALVRALVGVGELWLTAGSVALITSVAHPQGKRVGDVLAGTYAVRARVKARRRDVVPMPPELAAWAATADIRRLPDGLALSVRQLLVRAAGLHPDSRVRLGTDLAAEAARHVAPPPPPGTHPEAFLAAVVAERRTRETALAHAGARREAAETALMQRLPHQVPDPQD